MTVSGVPRRPSAVTSRSSMHRTPQTGQSQRRARRRRSRASRARRFWRCLRRDRSPERHTPCPPRHRRGATKQLRYPRLYAETRGRPHGRPSRGWRPRRSMDRSEDNCSIPSRRGASTPMASGPPRRREPSDGPSELSTIARSFATSSPRARSSSALGIVTSRWTQALAPRRMKALAMHESRTLNTATLESSCMIPPHSTRRVDLIQPDRAAMGPKVPRACVDRIESRGHHRGGYDNENPHPMAFDGAAGG